MHGILQNAMFAKAHFFWEVVRKRRKRTEIIELSP